MMINNNNQVGYASILQYVGDRILLGTYAEGERIPSVRDMAVQMEVNPITITRAYDRLQQLGAIRVQRGLGYFVADGAIATIREERLARFRNETIPELRRTLALLGITPRELSELLVEG
ncbi:MAG: GntR family transcriptional regulator [Porphyromonas sp.]|nr:GntR family transcriptional regulator [Porphyromonas sp.]